MGIQACDISKEFALSQSDVVWKRGSANSHDATPYQFAGVEYVDQRIVLRNTAVKRITQRYGTSVSGVSDVH